MEPEVYVFVRQSVRRLLNINLEGYKDEQMKRRLDSWLVRVGAASWADYFRRLNTDTVELARFRNYLTINVSAFFRDIERWNFLRDKVLPELLAAPRLRSGLNSTALRLWSAGCSIGLEPYSLAMLLDEMTPGRRHYLLGTDLDRGALAKAIARGPYLADDVKNVSPAQMKKYFQPNGPPYYVTETLAKAVTLREHNLLDDECETSLDLIICRNVVIYFTEEAKQKLYAKLQTALRPGGFLFMGGTEVLPRPMDLGFRNYGISFYQKM